MGQWTGGSVDERVTAEHPSPLDPRSPLLRSQDPPDHLAGLDDVHLVPEAAVAEEAAGAVFLLLGEGGDLVADLLEAVDPFGAVGEAEVDPAVADPGLQLLGGDRLGLRVGGDDDVDAAEDLSRVEEDGDAYG